MSPASPNGSGLRTKKPIPSAEQPQDESSPPAPSGWVQFALAVRALLEGTGPYLIAGVLLWMVWEKRLSDELGQVVVGAIVTYFFASKPSRTRK